MYLIVFYLSLCTLCKENGHTHTHIYIHIHIQFYRYSKSPAVFYSTQYKRSRFQAEVLCLIVTDLFLDLSLAGITVSLLFCEIIRAINPPKTQQKGFIEAKIAPYDIEEVSPKVTS